MDVYLDNAATTSVAPEVAEAMIPVLQEAYGNPSSSHAIGRKTRVIIEQSRRSIAKHLNCHPSSIYFTSGGTEADNLALRGAIRDLQCERIITSDAEHSAVIKTAQSLERSHGIQLDLVHHHEDGSVDLKHLEQLLASGPKTIVSLMHANNEVAVLQDLQAIGSLCRSNGALVSLGHRSNNVPLCLRFGGLASGFHYVFCAQISRAERRWFLVHQERHSVGRTN